MPTLTLAALHDPALLVRGRGGEGKARQGKEEEGKGREREGKGKQGKKENKGKGGRCLDTRNSRQVTEF